MQFVMRIRLAINTVSFHFHSHCLHSSLTKTNLKSGKLHRQSTKLTLCKVSRALMKCT